MAIKLGPNKLPPVRIELRTFTILIWSFTLWVELALFVILTILRSFIMLYYTLLYFVTLYYILYCSLSYSNKLSESKSQFLRVKLIISQPALAELALGWEHQTEVAEVPISNFFLMKFVCSPLRKSSKAVKDLCQCLFFFQYNSCKIQSRN